MIIVSYYYFFFILPFYFVLVNLGCYKKISSTVFLNNKYLLLTVLEAEESKIKVPER